MLCKGILLVPVKHAIKHGQDHKGQHRRTNDASNHDGSQWTLNLSTSTGGQGHWNEPKRCDQSSHQNWPEPSQRADSDTLGERPAFRTKPSHKADHYPAGEHSHSA